MSTILAITCAVILFPTFKEFFFAKPYLILRPPSISNDPVPILIPPPATPDPKSPSSSEAKASEWADRMQDIVMSLVSPGGDSGGHGVKDVEEEVNGMLVKDMERQQDDGKGQSKTQFALKTYGQPLMRIIGGIADKWERAGK